MPLPGLLCASSAHSPVPHLPKPRNSWHFPHFHKLFYHSEKKGLHLLITTLTPFLRAVGVGQRWASETRGGFLAERACVCRVGLISRCRSHSAAAPACPPAMHSAVENALIRILDRFSEVQAFQVFLVPPSLAICFHPTAPAPPSFCSASRVCQRANKAAEGWPRAGSAGGWERFPGDCALPG